MKVIIITCYMGKLPEWTELWMQSCSKNPGFDFLLVTDQQIQSPYSNVIVLNENLAQLKGRFSKVLGFNVCLPRAYKLCDFKPLYGFAFPEILKDYDFWGHCDLDQIFGCLEHFITDDILNKYDVIGKRGHLLLYRNCEMINNLYRCKGSLFSYKTVFTRPESYNFDEMGGMCRIVRRQKVRVFEDIHYGDSYTKYQRFYAPNGLHVPEIYCWIDGHIIRAYLLNNEVETDELSYLHFSRKYPKILANVSDMCYYMSSEKFEHRDDKSFTKEEILAKTQFLSEEDDDRQFRIGIKSKIEKLKNQSFTQRMVNLYFNIVFKLGL